jgi:hypothetical protein
LLGREKAARIGKEFTFAALAAKVITMAAVLGAMLGARWVDGHPANQILRHLRGIPSSAGVRMRVALVILMHRHAPRFLGAPRKGTVAISVAPEKFLSLA